MKHAMTAIGILGAGGRMGEAIAREIEGNAEATLAGGIDRDGDLTRLAAESDVLVDFSAPDALAAHLDSAAICGVPILIGTTGLAAAHHQAIEAAVARGAAVLQTANTSLGVILLAALVEEAARCLGPDWDVEIVDVHHRHKVDAPSGTALLLGGAVNQGRGAANNFENHCFDRMAGGTRAEGGIYFSSLRGGSVAGDHQVIFASDGERLELGHRAESRAIFAKGAVKAALWLAEKPAGRYTMKDVLGL